MDAGARGDLAESLVPLAAELAWLVRDEGREAIGGWLDAHGVIAGARMTEATRAFLVVLAAMVRADVTTEELLEWITWDEHGRPLGCPLERPARGRSPGSPLVAAEIRRARQRAGMTQRALAVAVGVTETTVQWWEYGKRTPGPESWQQLELTLGPLGVVREPEPGQERSEGEAA